MESQAQLNYRKVSDAINFIRGNYPAQPSLEEIAAHVNLSSFHFQRLFSEWAGVSPKKFLQYISLEHAKTLLSENRTVAEAADDAGLSGSSRLHDLFVNIEGMTPGDFQKGGTGLSVLYSFQPTPFGEMLIASTAKGICYASFDVNRDSAATVLTSEFPEAIVQAKRQAIHEEAVGVFSNEHQNKKLNLHLRGTAFQLKVWQALIRIPAGTVQSYSEIANAIDRPQASRAVGTAIGSNAVSFFIPCHRVIRATGLFGGYRWGTDRKFAMIGWEAARRKI